ncbi:MAG: DHH family phosphoesterase [Methanocellales archaeon]|nr:DHH family phosphoesterase [Methanocellales archaeon]MDD3291004.1 DHH family phosphoesterase [Methanocellales archaeon]MDD5234889.1 DHH family phosphoesterase [Methanocellales archaeon]MDD5484741.1 DHH family phosphoesterase [Methanocellales archaeon]
MMQKAAECAEAIKRHTTALVISHIDADGLTAAAVMCKALDRCGMEHGVRFLKKLDLPTLSEIADLGAELIIFTDLGSSMADETIKLDSEVIIADHHQPKKGQHKYHLNPHLFGINGTNELSGAGAVYLIAQKMGPNSDLADLAIVGAIGDMQDMRGGRLVGLNRSIMLEGVDAGVLSFETDIRLFGRQTRPIYKLLEYCEYPYIPGITGDKDNCIKFLHNLGISLKDEDWRRWIDLCRDEKKLIVSEIMQLCLKRGVPAYKVQHLVGEVYTLLKEAEGTELRDASEYSTLLNATARYDNADVGLAVCMGDRGLAYAHARSLLAQHRQNLTEGLKLVKEQRVLALQNLQYFHAGDNIRETIIGIIAGMSGNMEGINRNLPIIAFADSEEGIKVSARGTQDLVHQGLNLAVALHESAKEVGGVGGGHDIAAGATIPKGAEGEFLTILDAKIGTQLKRLA